ncbi:TetR/AcrR family transcriptional regulator [Humibacter albus]|uniref:TetR/AcrR family transcriptional regulator n=1 Tax=Humibacter albus TaxID=427754 RepID=UPI0003B7862A|nr:TetR/AcrR family transcriptional regulator [Humibacter albus]
MAKSSDSGSTDSRGRGADSRGADSRGAGSRDRWAAQIAALGAASTASKRKEPLTTERIMASAFDIVEAEGYPALTMRRVAASLKTGPASLYAHVGSKAELDDLLIGRLCALVELPTPDEKAWRAQILDVCARLRDQFLRYPGISQAALSATPHSLDTLRISEGMLGILLAGGVPAQSAAWAIDAAYLYVCAYCLEASLRRHPDQDADARALERDETLERFRMLPIDLFPHTIAHAGELTAGDGHERFDFTLQALFRGLLLDPEPATPARRTSR